jgi:TolB-like protein/AraC-like DNA-binding protein
MTSELSNNQTFIQKLIEIIEINLENEKFGVSELAAEAGLSRSSLHRKLHEIKGKSSSQFLREYRLEKAMQMLIKNQATASQIAYSVGFTSPTYFNTCFHNFYGYPPGEVKFQRAITPPKKTFSKKIMATIPVIILIGLLVFNDTSKKKSVDGTFTEKTIAVLPFVNDSSNEENIYFCNGIMAGIRDYLAKIPEFYVVSRLSVEPYRNTSFPLKVIAKDLGVNYIIEGLVQRIGNRAIISAELIQVNDNKVLWSERYDEDVSEIFTVQTNVIESITNNLEAIISPNLKTQLEAIPTQDTLAYEYYLKGEEYRFKANRPLQNNEIWLDLINNAKLSYELAIKSDSLYSEAYLGLALTVFERYVPYVNDENNLDEVLSLTNEALQINPNSSLAYLIRGDYYRIINEKDKAINDYEKTLEIIPNNSSAMHSLIYLYRSNNNYRDAVLTLKKTEKFAKSRDDLIQLYDNYIMFYRILDQHNMVDYYYNKIFEIHTIPQFNMARVWSYIQSNRYDEPINYVNENLHEDNQQRNGLLAYLYFCKKDFPKALKYYRKCYEQAEVEGINSLASALVYSGYGETLIRMGQINKGKKMLERQILINNDLLNSKRPFNKPIIYLSSIQIHASLGQYDKAYDYIKKFEAVNGWLYWEWMVSWVKKDPLFDFLLNDPIFKASLKRGEKQLEEVQNQIRPYFSSTPPIKTD